MVAAVWRGAPDTYEKRQLTPLLLSLLRKPRQTSEAAANTGSAWRRAFDRVFRRERIDAEFWDELEEALIVSDVGVQTTLDLVERAKRSSDERKLASTEEVKSLVRSEVASIFSAVSDAPPKTGDDEGKLALMMVGINGSGKTTTIGKLTHTARSSGDEVLIAAGDTFRAGAIRQAEVWAERTGARCISTQAGGDPGAVVFDAMRAARSQSADLVIVDTAGRLHTSANLMEELKKVRRILDRERGEYQVRVLLVLDANSGQNGLTQAREFNSAIDIDGIVLTKLDSSARGGIAVSICHELQLPIWYIGTGENMKDIAEFDGDEFAAALLPSGS